ncbi:MAG TPA: DUF1924 domain-containing protein [Mariprofundaceae bacterium]|nr:DUF1924 domain-containing protein [Mariprofundaceae bacterium]
MSRLIFAVMMLITTPSAWGSEAVVQPLLQQYRSEGASNFSAAHGRQIWTTTHVDRRSGKEISCASCHTSDLTRQGRHIRTGKLIEAMAPSRNPERLSDPDKIEKWFRRNCRSVLGRVCTSQEKGDLLMFIQSQ